jgi:pyruvate dehydrogenase E1 component alpha subunit
MSDPRKYRTKEEEAQFESRDCIEALDAWLQEHTDFTEDDFIAMSKAVKKEVRDCMKWADKSPAPDLSELYRDVYVQQWGPYTGTSMPQIVTDAES